MNSLGYPLGPHIGPIIEGWLGKLLPPACDVVCVTSPRAESFSFAQPQAAGGESGAKQRSTSHVRHIETSLTLNNRTVALCGVFSADVLAYRLTQNILQNVG